MKWLSRLLARAPQPEPLTADLLKRIRRSFEEAAADEEHFPSTIDPRIFHVRLLLRHIGDVNGGRVLDVGCGKGRFARLVRQENPGASVVALDLAETMLRSVPPELLPVSASMTALPFPDGSFQAAYATESLEHAVDIPLAVAELCRVVRPGGKILVIDKNRKQWAGSKPPNGSAGSPGKNSKNCCAATAVSSPAATSPTGKT